MSDAGQRGFTLMELVVVIVVIGLAGAALLRALPLTRAGAATPAQITLADQLAQERMELILASRSTLGFSSIADPCASGTPTPCTSVSGYTVTANGVPGAVNPLLAWSVDANTAHFRVVTVTVTGPTGSTLAIVTGLLGNY